MGQHHTCKLLHSLLWHPTSSWSKIRHRSFRAIRSDTTSILTGCFRASKSPSCCWSGRWRPVCRTPEPRPPSRTPPDRTRTSAGRPREYLNHRILVAYRDSEPRISRYKIEQGSPILIVIRVLKESLNKTVASIRVLQNILKWVWE